MDGILFPAELSPVRRGSHVLYIDGDPAYYVESQSVNLRALEQKRVTLSGILEYNTHSQDLPVLVVSEATPVQEEMREWRLQSLGLSFTAPERWQRSSINNTSVQFRVGDREDTVLTITRSSQETAAEGVSILIGGRNALRIIDESSGAEEIRVHDTDSFLSLRFTPWPDDADVPLLKQEWLSILRSIVWTNTESTSSRSTPHSGTGAGLPCGGTAGVLCPTGYFCDITDLQENIGLCKNVN